MIAPSKDEIAQRVLCHNAGALGSRAFFPFVNGSSASRQEGSRSPTSQLVPQVIVDDARRDMRIVCGVESRSGVIVESGSRRKTQDDFNVQQAERINLRWPSRPGISFLTALLAILQQLTQRERR